MINATAWPKVPLGELLAQSNDRVPVEAGREYPNFGIFSFGRGLFPKQPINGTSSSATTLYRATADQFVYSRLFAFEGAYGIVVRELDGCFVSNEFPLFNCDRVRIVPGYLGWLFRYPQVWSHIAQLTTGMGNRRRRVKPEALLKYSIFLPPLEEQQRIVAKINRLAGKIDEAISLKVQRSHESSQLAASFTHDLFTRQLHGRVETIPLGNIADIRSGVTLGREISAPCIELPYLRVANVQDGFLDLTLVKVVKIRQDESEKWLLKSGDLLLTEGGDWDKLGRGCIWDNQIPNCIHQNHIFRVRVNSHEFDPSYLLALTGSAYGKAYFQGMSKQTTNLASINQTQLKAFPVYRVPIDEQKRIVARVRGVTEKVDELKITQKHSDTTLNAMLSSVLDCAFKGAL